MGNEGIALQDRARKGIRAIKSKDWAIAQSVWESLLHCSDESLRQKSFTYVAMSTRYLSDLEYAERVAADGLRCFPQSLTIRREYAAIAAAKGNWGEARDRWSALMERAGNKAPLAAYIGLARALRKLGSYDAAEQVAAEGLSAHNDAVGLLRELAELAMQRGDWSSAISQYQRLVNQLQGQAAESAYVRLSTAFLRNKQFAEADDCIREGLVKCPNSPRLLRRLGENWLAARDWGRAIEEFKRFLQHPAGEKLPNVYERLSFAHRMAGDPAEAKSVLQAGLKAFPGEASLSFALAEVSMVLRDWPEAAKRWVTVFVLEQSASSEPGYARYIQSKAGDWDVDDWCRLAEYLKSDPGAMRSGWLHELLPNLTQILMSAGCTREACSLLDKALSSVGLSKALKIAYSKMLLRENAIDEAVEVLAGLQSGDPESEVVSLYRNLIFRCYMSGHVETAEKLIGEPGRFGALMRGFAEEHHNIIAQLKKLGNEKDPERVRDASTIQFLLIQYREDSPLADIIESGIYLTRDSIGAWLAQEVGDKMGSVDTWWAGRFMRGVARRLSWRYGEKYKNTPVLTASALADAVYHPFFTELSNLVPLRHLARKLSSEVKGRPVFIELQSTEIEFVNFWGPCQVEPIYLYMELRRRGIDAFLCRRFEAEDVVDPKPRLAFVPSARFKALATMKVDASRKVISRTAVAPDGIRGVDQIFEPGSVHMLASSNITLNRPYSRTLQQKPLRFNATLFEGGLLPKAEQISFAFAGALGKGSAAYFSEPCEINLFKWFDRLFGKYLETLGKRSIDFVIANNIHNLYICDHLFMQSALLTRAMRLLRKKVHLLPHSANPVHVQFRSQAEIASVTSILKSGLKSWQASLGQSEVELVHDPRSMLPVPNEGGVKPATHNDSGCLSVVIIDSGLSMGRLPRLRVSKQLALFRSFVAGIYSLPAGVDVYFRGKGRFGGDLTWFRDHNGRPMNWTIVREHPLEMNLQNMIFVSIGFGSSAIFEGIARGVPGMIVREDKVEDYTLIDGSIIPTGSVEDIVSEIARCRSLSYRNRLLERELEFYCFETGYQLQT